VARLTKSELIIINQVLSSRAANLSAAVHEVLHYCGVPEFVQRYLMSVLNTDSKYREDLRELRAPGYRP
jgi:hypothetical protein